jgi:hypothetical protein
MLVIANVAISGCALFCFVVAIFFGLDRARFFCIHLAFPFQGFQFAFGPLVFALLPPLTALRRTIHGCEQADSKANDF